ncbi:MAG: DUF4139 domain-containing protein [Flavobacteriales bacterium]
MKKLLLPLAFFTFSTPIFSANFEKDIKSKIRDVTVYLNGAQVSRRGNVALKKGVNTIFFNDVSPYVNQKTIQVKGLGDYIILDTKKGIKYPEPTKAVEVPTKITREIATKRDSLQNIDFEIANISQQFRDLKIEKDFLLKNRVFTKDTLPTLMNSLAYLRKQLFEINDLEQKLKKDQRELSTLRNSIQYRISLLNNYSRNNTPKNNAKPIHQIAVTVQATREMKGNMTVTYFVSNASWSPSYDIRVKDISSPVDLTMKATVYQNTQEDWENVKLTLSTNNPYKNKIKPELSVWYINYYNPNMGYYRDANKLKKKSQVAQLNSVKVTADSYIESDKEEESLAYRGSVRQVPSAVSSTNYTVKSQSMANVEYKIDLRYSIKADNKAHMVAVEQQAIKAKYSHYLVPKYDKESYLVAQLLDWEDLDLLPSKANLFYEGSYIGETRINPTANDTLYISLGNDRNVRIKRTKDKEKSRDKVFSNRKSTTISYDLFVKNMSTRKYNIIVEDHIPVSRDKSIEVTLESKSRANFNEKTGLMKWEFDLKARGNKKLNYTYKVEYDNNKRLDLSKF